MKPALSILWRAGAVFFSLAGLAGFIRLFARDMNIYWFILAPIIFAVYQVPAVIVYALWKKKHRAKTAEISTGESADTDSLLEENPPPESD